MTEKILVSSWHNQLDIQHAFNLTPGLEQAELWNHSLKMSKK